MIFLCAIRNVRNFDGALGGDINSVSRDEEANNYRQEDGCKTDLKKSCESKSLVRARSSISVGYSGGRGVSHMATCFTTLLT